MRMRRNRRLGIALVAATALILSACGSDDGDDGGEATETEPAAETEESMAPTDESMAPSEGGTSGGGEAVAAIQESGTLRVGIKYDQPLFGVNTPSGVVGFDAEIATAIAESLGVEPEFQEAVSANREPFLQEDQVDLVAATYTINEERDEVVDFAGPYYVAGQDIMVATGNPEGIEGIESLNTADLTTCTVEGSTSLENLNEMAPDADVLTFDTYSKCADAMRQGRAAAVTTDNVILIGLIDEAPDDFELIDNPFTEEPYGIGVQEGSDLRCYVNGVLQTMYDDGSWAEAYEATVGSAGVSTPEPPELNNEGC
ncbi:glutamate ABC transporter substrate-binding protein [Salsipaludibacter albus]|uniref:glutamate ABC transporter substrate-binding protein n=1 Tax=Salsipaludibacter albus TaxID=2849650 RepID=UPI001EE3D56C|nr:glutamate ABC transporter substrate-binding protein [Salsipaludibacter albus]